MDIKNKPYVWVAAVIVGVGGYFIYKEFTGKPVVDKNITREEAIDIILKSGRHQDRASLETIFGEDFLKIWAISILEKKATFAFGDKMYYTQGGTTVKYKTN
jgi:hypothetical protein